MFIFGKPIWRGFVSSGRWAAVNRHCQCLTEFTQKLYCHLMFNLLQILDMVATAAMLVMVLLFGLAWLIYQKLGLGETSNSVRLVGPAKMWRRREDCSRLERVPG